MPESSSASLKRSPPAAMRNAAPITDVLMRVFDDTLRERDVVLEIAAGSGYHAAAFAQAMPCFTWQPSEPDAEARVSITAHVEDLGLANLLPPLDINVCAETWPAINADAVLCINMIHISPWEATLGLLKGAGRLLKKGAPLVTYGPYAIDGDFGAESNAAFDLSLKDRNPLWGIRDVKDIEAAAQQQGFQLQETVPMPANNFTLIFQKTE